MGLGIRERKRERESLKKRLDQIACCAQRGCGIAVSSTVFLCIARINNALPVLVLLHSVVVTIMGSWSPRSCKIRRHLQLGLLGISVD